jgi:preprotein translocase subunit SecA
MDQMENLGALHEILTFMPRNKRIKCQAFGRAARKGEKGSGQIIMETKDSYERLLNLQLIEKEDEFNFLNNISNKIILNSDESFIKMSN